MSISFMNISHTTKSNPDLRLNIDEVTAHIALKNNTLLTVFKILDSGEIEVIALDTDYCWDFIKKEVKKWKSFIGSCFVSKWFWKKTKIATDKITRLIDTKLWDESLKGEAEEIMKNVKKWILDLLVSDK